ncbi:MAG TPA: 50S ribosomal protein L4, partial [Chloroflexi bacterium]|nr:50S ribosomal protein L4 [Chloroflexota bacterium]
MKIPVYNMAGQEVDSVELPSSIFEAKINRDLMHQALVRQMANARLGTHKTKSRGEVRLTGAKAYRQKGTGNARHGSRRAPIFVGGGVAHGPRPRKYTKKMPRKMRRAALRSALSAKARDEEILLLDDISLDAPKTKAMAALLEQLQVEDSALLLLAEENENVERSARNLA